MEQQIGLWKALRDKNVLLCKACWTINLWTQEFSDKNNIKVNLFQYYYTSAIPAYFNSYTSVYRNLGVLKPMCKIFDFQVSKDITLNLKKTLCKHFHKLFLKKLNREPNAIKLRRKIVLKLLTFGWTASKTVIKSLGIKILGNSISICCTEY